MALGIGAWYGCKLKSKLYKQQHNHTIQEAFISSQPSSTTAHKDNLPFFSLLTNSQTAQQKNAENKAVLIDEALGERGVREIHFVCANQKANVVCQIS